MWYGDKRESVVNIMFGLIEKGWKVYGFKEDRSDSMTDYYDPAYWDGVAEKDGYILLVDVCEYNFKSYSGKQVTENTYKLDYGRIRKLEALRDDPASPEGEKQACQYQIDKMRNKAKESTKVVEVWPTFHFANPGKCNWHIEKDGVILDKGIGAYQISTDLNKYREEGKKDITEKFNQWYARIEKAMTTDNQLEKQVKQVINKVIKPVEVAAVKPIDFKKQITCIKMEVGYTGGLYKGTILTYVRTYEGTHNNYIFVKLGKKLKPLKEKAENMLWLSDEKLNKMIEKGHISFVELQEVEEVTEKIVYTKTARKVEQETNNNEEVITIAGEVVEVEEQQQDEAEQEQTFEAVTSKQLFALHMASKRTIDTRGLNISKQQASELIGRSKAGEDITEELKAIKEGHKIKNNTNVEQEPKSKVIDFQKVKEQKAAEEPKDEEQTGGVEEMKQTKPYIKGIAFNYGVWAYQRGINRVPAQDQKFMMDILADTQVGEPSTIKYLDEWLSGWDNENLKNEEQPEQNNSDTFAFDDILGAFEDVEIENNTRIDNEDLTFCENLQANYDEFLKFHDNYLEFMKNNQVSNNLYNNHELSTNMIKQATEKTTSFINKIVRHFENKYNITINEDKFNKIYTAGSVTYEDIIDQIFIQLDGHSLTEQAEKEIKNNMKEKVRYEKLTIKNNKLTITDYLWFDSWAWNGLKISYSDEKLKTLFKALSHFESHDTDMNDTFSKIWNEFYEGSNKHDILSKYLLEGLKKVKTFKVYRNKKIEIEFSSNQLAQQFASEYCGVVAKTAAV